MDNLYIIIRGAKERTETLCLSIAQNLVGKEKVTLLNEPSFAQAHIRSMEIAAQYPNDSYVILLDADILLIEDNFIQNVRKGISEFSHKKFYMINFRIFDRQCISPAYGIHLYRADGIKRALPYKNIALNAQKPETAICKKMVSKGLKTYNSTALLGFHGYEQYYFDMYRTAYVRGVKYHKRWDFYIATFYQNKEKHDDFFWSYIGMIDGIIHNATNKGIASLRREDYREKFNKHLIYFQKSEKEKLSSKTAIPNLSEEMMYINPLYESNKAWLASPKVGYSEPKTLRNWLKKVIKRLKNL